MHSADAGCVLLISLVAHCRPVHSVYASFQPLAPYSTVPHIAFQLSLAVGDKEEAFQSHFKERK